MIKKDNPIEVLFLSHRYNITSGGEKALLEQISYLASLNISQHVVIGGKGDIITHLDKLRVPYTVVHLPFWAHGGEDLSPFVFNQQADPTNNTLLKLVELITSLQPKLCVTNTIVVPWLAYASAITNKPHAWMIHELDESGLNLRYAISKEQVLRTIDVLSDKIFYNSHYTADHYLPKLIFNKKASVIYPVGITTNHKQILSPFKTQGLKIICVGQIKEQKGQIDAINAVALLKKEGVLFELLLVGGVNPDDKLYGDTLIELIEENDLRENVRLLGYTDNPLGLMEHADIVLNCATNETFGRVTVEAMLSGTAVIGANSAGTAEVINPNVTGLLYEPGNHRILADELIRLYKNHSLLSRLAKNGQSDAQAKYSDAERFKPFAEYLKGKPSKTALDLTPLRSVFEDFQSTTIDVNRQAPLHLKVWRKLKPAIKRALKRP